MNRTPPLPVQRMLRKEVNFGCPVPKCGEPFLSWHHFDPPWRIREHHNPNGMVALCVKHHKMADEGLFSPEQIRHFKNNPNDTDFIKTRFEWTCQYPIVRLGGCYGIGGCEIRISGLTVFGTKTDENGQTVFSFVLKDEEDNIFATMNDNIFSFSNELLDDLSVSASGDKIRVWFDERMGFECQYSRVSKSEIEKNIETDRERAARERENTYTPDMPDFMKNFKVFDHSPEPISDLEEFYQELSEIRDKSDVVLIGQKRHDMVGTLLRWHLARHTDVDGKIPIIDLLSCRFWNSKKYLDLRNGRALLDSGSGESKVWFVVIVNCGVLISL